MDSSFMSVKLVTSVDFSFFLVVGSSDQARSSLGNGNVPFLLQYVRSRRYSCPMMLRSLAGRFSWIGRRSKWVDEKKIAFSGIYIFPFLCAFYFPINEAMSLNQRMFVILWHIKRKIGRKANLFSIFSPVSYLLMNVPGTLAF